MFLFFLLDRATEGLRHSFAFAVFFIKTYRPTIELHRMNKNYTAKNKILGMPLLGIMALYGCTVYVTITV